MIPEEKREDLQAEREPDDVSLTIAACQGSTEAFEALVTRYEPQIRRMIYSLTRDRHLTQDLCQETFLAAYRAVSHAPDVKLRFAPWLYRIALNKVRDEWRRCKHVTVGPFSPPQGYGEDMFSEPGEGYLECPEQFEVRVEQRDLIAHVLARLPTHYAACLLLDAEGFSYREVAEITQDSLSAIRARIPRARRAFQQMYTQLEHPESRFRPGVACETNSDRAPNFPKAVDL